MLERSLNTAEATFPRGICFKTPTYAHMSPVPDCTLSSTQAFKRNRQKPINGAPSSSHNRENRLKSPSIARDSLAHPAFGAVS